MEVKDPFHEPIIREADEDASGDSSRYAMDADTQIMGMDSSYLN